MFIRVIIHPITGGCMNIGSKKGRYCSKGKIQILNLQALIDIESSSYD